MSDNIYTAPQAELHTESNESFNEFYVVSKTKFLVLAFATLGLYNVYWFYKNWSGYKAQHDASIWPVPRAIFSIFFINSLLSKIDEKLEKNRSTFNWNIEMLALIYIVFSVLSHICDRLSDKDIGSPFTDFVSIIVLPLTIYPLYIAQKAINISANDPEGTQNARFTVANYIWIFFGGLIWLLLAAAAVSMFFGII